MNAPRSLQKPYLQVLWALGLAIAAVIVASIYGDPNVGLVVGGVVLCTYALTAALGKLSPRRRKS